MQIPNEVNARIQSLKLELIQRITNSSMDIDEQSEAVDDTYSILSEIQELLDAVREEDSERLEDLMIV